MVFNEGLNATLIDALAKLAKHVPSQHINIRARLLDVLSLILSQARHTHSLCYVYACKSMNNSRGDMMGFHAQTHSHAHALTASKAKIMTTNKHGVPLIPFSNHLMLNLTSFSET